MLPPPGLRRWPSDGDLGYTPKLSDYKLQQTPTQWIRQRDPGYLKRKLDPYHQTANEKATNWAAGWVAATEAAEAWAKAKAKASAEERLAAYELLKAEAAARRARGEARRKAAKMQKIVDTEFAVADEWQRLDRLPEYVQSMEHRIHTALIDDAELAGIHDHLKNVLQRDHYQELQWAVILIQGMKKGACA